MKQLLQYLLCIFLLNKGKNARVVINKGKGKCKAIPLQAQSAQRVPGR